VIHHVFEGDPVAKLVAPLLNPCKFCNERARCENFSSAELLIAIGANIINDSPTAEELSTARDPNRRENHRFALRDVQPVNIESFERSRNS
jgi:hypothetical protein